MKPVNIPAFATAQLDLLANEQKAEVDETALLTSTHSPSVLARAGLAITNLNVNNQKTGLGGKTVLDLGLDPAVSSVSKELPQHGIRVGDIVGVAEQPKGSEKKKDRTDMEKKGVHGVVVKVMREFVVVALDKEDVDVPNGKLWLVKLANDVTYKRMNQTMTKLSKMTESEHAILARVLFGQSSPSPISDSDMKEPVEWLDPSLNDSQKEAIRFALASREVALIHGPPGTGKTHTLIELILQMIRRKKRILVCGPSNISVDNIVERLAPHRIPIVRLGHPARLLPKVLDHSLEVLTKTSDAAELVNDIRQELDAKQATIRKTKSGRERHAIYGDMRELRKEYRERESKCIDSLVRGSQIVLSTLHGAGSFQLKNQNFDVVIIDEASQALEASCWIPLLGYGASQVVLAGDHLQLPPTIKSSNMKVEKPTKSADREKAGKSDKEKEGKEVKEKQGKEAVTLERTMFDRLLDLHGNKIKRMLTTQYRMHEKIMDYPSKSLYEGMLMAAEAVRQRTLAGLPYEVKESEDTEEPLVFYDTQGGDFFEKTEDDESGISKSSLLGDSKSNPSEAQVVRMHVEKLVDCGVKAEDIAVITPYNGQLALLSQLLKERFPGMELGSVDGFQGREKEAVIVSLTRSNAEGEVGFLSEKRRLNVAMTRPKRHLCVIGDSETVSRGGKFLKAWMSFLEENADLRYPDISEALQQG
ncbi:DNA polymerase alpha-associated DNA helicase A [Elsinoe australis]|uniref:DNA helicase n=1 Tax=Elsinoe australis TaxID=40998 RepID=A0A2P7YIW6_9PEZI|nr:DNA polymerase alpha-associated DNA helicase A [Elsinoe australis]